MEVKNVTSPRRPIPEDFLLSVVIPVFNEQKTIETVLRRVDALPYCKQVIVVDDGSTDGTRDTLREPACARRIDRVILHDSNSGKGAAL